MHAFIDKTSARQTRSNKDKEIENNGNSFLKMNSDLEMETINDILDNYLQEPYQTTPASKNTEPRTKHNIEPPIIFLRNSTIKYNASDIIQMLFAPVEAKALVQHQSDCDQSEESVDNDSETSQTDYKKGIVDQETYENYFITKVANSHEITRALAHQIYGNEDQFGTIEDELTRYWVIYL
jgi:hypothetical protein